MADTMPITQGELYPPIVPPRTQFSFETAITLPFRTSGGRQFAFRLFGWTTLIMAVIVMLAGPLMLEPFIDFMDAAERMESIEGETDPDIIMAEMGGFFAVFGRFMLAIFLLTFGLWFVWVSAEAALHRKVFRDEEAPRLPLRFGRDELRVAGAQALVTLMNIGVYIGAIVLGVITIGIGFLITIPGMIFLFFFLILSYCAASALSVRDGRFRFGESRRVTKGRKGALLGTYVVITILGYVAMTIIQTIALQLVLGSSFGETLLGSTTGTLDYESLSASLTSTKALVGWVAFSAFYAAIYAVWYLALSGVGAYALLWYEQDAGDVSVFD